MSYQLIFSDSALKFLKKQDKQVARRILKALEKLKDQPETKITKLVNSPYYRFRIGDYRAIMRIEHGMLIIYIITLQRRDKIYRKK